MSFKVKTVEIKHKAYWAVKTCNFSIDQAGEERNIHYPLKKKTRKNRK